MAGFTPGCGGRTAAFDEGRWGGRGGGRGGADERGCGGTAGGGLGGRAAGAAFPGAGVPDTERSLGLPAAKISPMPAGGPLEGSDGAEGGRGALARTDAVTPPDEVPPPETLPPTVGADLSFVWTFFSVLPFLIAS